MHILYFNSQRISIMKAYEGYWFLVRFALFDLEFYVYFVDSCLSFCALFFWSLCCLFFFDLRILITPLVSTSSSYKAFDLSRIHWRCQEFQLTSTYFPLLCFFACLQLRNNALRIKHRYQRYSKCSTFPYKIKLQFVQRTLTVSIYCAIVKTMHIITDWVQSWVKYKYSYYHRGWTGLLNASSPCQGMNYNHIVQQPYSYTCQYNNQFKIIACH